MDGEHKAPRYFIVFAVLALFTAMEVGLTRLHDLPQGIKIAVLIFLAVTKVGLVLLYFMHLKYDTRAFFLPFILGAVVAAPLIIILTLSPPPSGEDNDEVNASGAPASSGQALGEQVVQEKCSMCHDLERVQNASYDREGWEEIVDRMIGYGCPINDDERQLAIDYLASDQTIGGAAAQSTEEATETSQ